MDIISISNGRLICHAAVTGNADGYCHKPWSQLDASDILGAPRTGVACFTRFGWCTRSW
jgi:hypothetical protein